MMITIQGLAPTTKYTDVKLMIKQECNIDDFILDNLVHDGDGTKKVRIGLANENEGYKLMKCLNGYHMPGNYVVKVSPIGKPAASGPPGGYDARSGNQNQQRNDYQNPPRTDYTTQSNSNEYNRSPRPSNAPRGPPGQHGPNGQHRPGGPNKPYGSSGSHSQAPPDSRLSPWLSNNNTSNQWSSNQSMTSQVPQNSFNFGSGVQQSPSSGYMPQHSGHNQNPRTEIRPFDQGRQGPTPEQNYGGYAPKSSVPARQTDLRQNLRSIDTRDGGNQAPPSMHGQGGRFPTNQYQQDKSLTIMKDNFQGPTPFNIIHPAGNQPQYQQRGSTAQWNPQGQQPKPPVSKSFEERKYAPGDQPRDPKNVPPRSDTYKDYEKRRGYSPTSRDPMPRRSSPGRREELHREPAGRMSDMGPRRSSPSRMDPSQRRISPPGRRDDPIGRRDDPIGRRDDPIGRRDDPVGRRDDPVGRRDDPVGRRDDPVARRDDPVGRRDDPIARRYSPPGKRISPAGDRRNLPRHESPHKRVSPSRRLASPGRRDERPIPRYSPGRHHSDKMGDKFGQDKDVKKVRPAYEPTSSHAPNQASSMYSGGFRSSNHDNVQYPIPGMRQEQSAAWHRHIDEQTIPMKKHDVERRQMARERVPDQIEKRYSPSRKSRSPIRRDRSPIRDRFKRSSLSPRSSYSPRRSWALEKRRSPDAPPPPVWPGQNTDRDHSRPIRPNFPEKDEKPKHQPVWEGRSFKEEELRNRRPEAHRSYDEAKIRVAKELIERESLTHADTSDRYQRKFSPRDDYEERRDNYRRRDLPERKPHADDSDLPRRPREEDRFDDYNRRRESPRRESKIETPKDFDKDFEDIYNRAVQFKKKAEELRKSGSRKRDDFDDIRRHGEKIDDTRQRYEDHERYREEESLRQREGGERLPRDDRRPDQVRSGDDRARRDGDRRDDYRSRDKDRQIETTNSSNRQKREKAVEEIAQKILDKNEEYKNVQGEQRQYILEELKQIVTKIVYEMFGDTEVSFIEVIIKYQARYNLKDEAKILQDAIRSLPKQFRAIKRHAPESANVPAKSSRISPSSDLNQGRGPAQTSLRPNHSHLVFKKKLVPKPQQQIIKPTPRTIESEGRVMKEASKAPAINAKRTVQVPKQEPRKPELKKQEPKKPEPETTNVVKSPPTPEKACGDYELNALMTRMVDVELRDLMKKTFTNLLENPADEIERRAVQMLRNEGALYLKNVLGLNITKRLLNVYNPLYVKIKFNGKPEKEELREFLKKYNFIGFARKAVNIFAAQVKSIDDFDRLCTEEEVICGSVKVSVSPEYKFITCPPNLNTKYDNAYLEDIEIYLDRDEELNNVEIKNICGTSKNIKSPEKQDNISPTKAKLETVKLEKIKEKVEVQAAPVPVSKNVLKGNKVTKPVDSVNKSTQNISSKEITKKLESPIAIKNKDTENKFVTPSKPVTKITTPQKQTTGTAATKLAPAKTVTKVNPTKTVTQVSPVKNITKVIRTEGVAKVTPQKPAVKVTPTKMRPQKYYKLATPKKSTDDEDDYDELDDHDILALMSEGIVLDECCGSDEE